ncbi:hypothetical protein GGI42DRAFT_1549 [Trichoderma sp. SZMC 28013]
MRKLRPLFGPTLCIATLTVSEITKILLSTRIMRPHFVDTRRLVRISILTFHSLYVCDCHMFDLKASISSSGR